MDAAPWTLEAAFISGSLFVALCAALILTIVAGRSARSVRPAPLLIAATLVGGCLVLAAILPCTLPPLAAVAIAPVAIALATLGGNPFVRWALAAADGGKTPEGTRGGILVEMMATQPSPPRQEEILRGGTTIGYLERVGASLGIIAGFPAVIAVIVALKGVGRFTELSTPAARERFIVGTMASLVWACAVAAIVPLAL